MKESSTALAPPQTASFESRAPAASLSRHARRSSRSSRVWAIFAGIPANLLVALISAYRRTLSPLLPAFLGPGCGCRFHPTCACYAMEAIQVHGAIYGTGLTVKRLVKCAPYHPGGFDPVPPRPSARVDRAPRATVAAKTASA